jgi:hypothetical protein
MRKYAKTGNKAGFFGGLNEETAEKWTFQQEYP